MNNDLATLKSEERKQRLVWMLALLALAVVAFLQRNQRSLIIDGGAMPTASAFTAITPPVPGIGGVSPTVARLLGGRLAAAGPSRPSAFFAQGVPDAPAPGSAAGPQSPAGSPPAAATTGAQLSPSVLAAQTAGPSIGSNGGAAGPAGPQQTAAAASAVPATATAPGGPAVGAVPEPSTWMMMMMGLAGIGYMLRRRARQIRDAG